MTHTLVLADACDSPALRLWLAPRARVLDEIARSHSELGCVQLGLDDGTVIDLLADHVGEVAYAKLTGPRAAAWAQSIAGRFRCLSIPNLLPMLHDGADPRQWIRALTRLAVLRSESSDQALLGAWSRALAHPHRAVRRAAIRTCHGSRWPELRAVVGARIGVDHGLRGPLEQLAAHLDRISRS